MNQEDGLQVSKVLRIKLLIILGCGVVVGRWGLGIRHDNLFWPDNAPAVLEVHDDPTIRHQVGPTLIVEDRYTSSDGRETALALEVHAFGCIG